MIMRLLLLKFNCSCYRLPYRYTSLGLGQNDVIFFGWNIDQDFMKTC